eukprot:Seg2498.6 transcript_id=Seg2498.6/GoldUCD/mRNA.D3Y31 product="hypothetical protein" protein_id=Seg2498.6/GoldUCD/D3Y31
MKIACLFFTLLVTTLAKEFSLNVEEGMERFQETVKIDTSENTEKIIVPAHGDRQRLELLNDFSVGYSASKIVALQKCFISVIENSEQRPGELEHSLEKFNSTFGTGEFTVKSYKVLPLHEMTSEEVGPKIASHCTGMKMYMTKSFLNGNIEEEAAKLLGNSASAGRGKRSVTNNLPVCDSTSALHFARCPRTRGQLNAAINCKYLRYGSTCIYVATNCVNRGHYFDCQSIHSYSQIFCCTIRCNTQIISI